MNDIIIAAVQLGLTVAAFLVGKYVYPKISTDVAQKLSSLSAWAVEFVSWAKEFKKASTGEEKMEAVVKKLKEIADEAGWNVTEDQLRAIAQSAYNAMKGGETIAATATLESATITPTATVVINTMAAPTVNTAEKVSVATDNVPEGATGQNPDGTVNLYDSAGNIIGSVTEKEAEQMAAEVTKIVEDSADGK